MRHRRAHPRADALEQITRLGALPLDPATVAAIGPVRAASDAVREHPLSNRAREEAEGGPVTLGACRTATTALTRRTAVASAAADASRPPHRP